MNSKTSPVDSSPILSCERTSVSLFFFITLTFQAHSRTPEHLWLGADIIETTADGACTGVFYWAPECFQTSDFEGNMHGYALGAFRNARPTQIMRSFTRASRLMSGKRHSHTASLLQQPFFSRHHPYYLTFEIF